MNKTVGVLLIFTGLGLVVWALLSTISISTESPYGGTREIINVGLIAKREMIYMGGWFTILIGVLVTVTAFVIENMSIQRRLLENEIDYIVNKNKNK